MPFDPVRKVTAAVQVANAIRKQVLGGGLQPGDALPSERELARQLQVNRSTVREALHRLEATGLVEIRQGGATRVNDFLVTAGLRILPLLVAPAGVPDAALLQDLMEIRCMLLSWTARMVARGAATDDDAARIASSRLPALVAALGQAETSPTELQRLDFDFFEELVRLAGNRVLSLMVDPVRQVYFRNRSLFEVLYQPGRFDARHHTRALSAIEAGDEQGAALAMEQYGRTARFAAKPSSQEESR